jgi:hypothetical protein
VSVNVARACIRAALYDAFRDGFVDVNEAACLDFIRTIQRRLGILDGLLQSRSRFTAWRRESNTKKFIASLFQQ